MFKNMFLFNWIRKL